MWYEYSKLMELKTLNLVIHAFLYFTKFGFSSQFSLMNFQHWKSSEYVNSTPETPQVLELDSGAFQD